jgi:DNA polymerase-3 subunit epsilon
MDLMENPFDPGQPLAKVEFTLFDVETTGLSPAYGHRVCEVACLRVCDGAEIGRFESLVDPGRPISPGAFHVNRITPEMLRGVPAFHAVASPVLALMDGAALVAHNAPFDLGFLAAELEIAQLPPPEGPVVDTLTLARRVYRFASNSLPAVASALGVEPGPSHRAMGDVWTTSQVLDRILWDLDRRWGVRTLGQLLAFQGGSIPYPLPRVLPLPPTIAEALQGGGRVRMRYVNAAGQETDRVVRPLRVSEERGNLYLVAHCYRAGELRTFRLDRVVEMALEATDEPGELPC